MRFEIVPMRVKGRPLGKRERKDIKPVVADVHIRMENESPLGRPSRIAEVHRTPPYEMKYMILYDATIEGMATTGAVITGVEIVDDIAYAQSWWIRLV
jgi:hypothetical protein